MPPRKRKGLTAGKKKTSVANINTKNSIREWKALAEHQETELHTRAQTILDMAAQIEQLTKARDEQAKLAAESKSKNRRLQSDTKSYQQT